MTTSRLDADSTSRYVGRHVAAIGRSRRGPRHQKAVAHVAAAAARRQRRGRVAAANDDRRRGKRHGEPGWLVVVFDGGTRREISTTGRLTFAKHISRVGVQLS